LKQLVDGGAVPQARIDDAVLRILRVKIAMGLMDKGKSQLADRSLHRTFGSVEHRAVARDCVRQSIVILKNEGRLLPLDKAAGHIHVAGDSADDIGNQCGGWTVFWQGRSGEVTLGTTILEGIRDAAGSGTKITYAADGAGGSGAKVGVAVFGEAPYAEMFGDRADLRLDAKHIGVAARMKADGMRVVVVLTSGRPMIIDDLLPYTDAVVAAWLPGSEGDGVADVLFGAHRPTGKLSFSWPKASTTDYHIGSAGYQKLFDVGYGLSY
jgi:beta-glucosidase